MAQVSARTGGPINLAHVPPFRLGEVEVYPATRQLIRGERRETLEPRVMQVLVALAQAEGEVLTRDELIERCWSGRIVGENAINRVISRIRQIAADFGMDSFQLETITKVGYRIIVRPEERLAARGTEAPSAQGSIAAPHSPTPGGFQPSRRFVIGAAVAASCAAATGGVFIWTRSARHRPHPEALELYRRGEIAQRQGVPEQTRQAVSFFKQATEVDPLYAQAWGALSLSYRHSMEAHSGRELESFPNLIKSAARRALALDPDNPDAQLALIIVKPYYRNWGWMEAELDRIGQRHPDHWFVQAQLGLIRYEVGRWRDGLPHTERQLQIESFAPVAHMNRARALWSTGRLQETEASLDAAIKRWPAHYGLWNFKFGFLLLSGRPASAAAFVMAPENQPEDLRPDAIATRVTLARAVERRHPEDIKVSLAHYHRLAMERVENIHSVAPIFVLLGRPELALGGLERYYLGSSSSGSPATPPGPYERRFTQFLFTPDMAQLWPERRFSVLLERIGLEDYWRSSRTAPDYRNRA